MNIKEDPIKKTPKHLLTDCEACGERRSEETGHCPECGAEVDNGAKGEIFYTEFGFSPVIPGE